IARHVSAFASFIVSPNISSLLWRTCLRAPCSGALKADQSRPRAGASLSARPLLALAGGVEEAAGGFSSPRRARSLRWLRADRDRWGEAARVAFAASDRREPRRLGR